MTQKKFSSSLGKIVNICLEPELLFFLDGTFKSCPRQFAQLYSLHVDLGSTSHDNYIYPVLFALLPDKKETAYSLLTLLKNWCVFWLPKIIKVDFEAAVISAINKVFAGSVITGCNFHFNQCLWRQITKYWSCGGIQRR
jgi:hypothetical protein